MVSLSSHSCQEIGCFKHSAYFPKRQRNVRTMAFMAAAINLTSSSAFSVARHSVGNAFRTRRGSKLFAKSRDTKNLLSPLPNRNQDPTDDTVLSRDVVKKSTVNFHKNNDNGVNNDLNVSKKVQQFEALLHKASHPKTTVDSFDPFELEHRSDVRIRSSTNVKEPLSKKDNDEKSSKIMGDIWKARLLLIAAAALYGTNFTMVKIIGENLPVGVSTTLRFALAAAVTIPWLLAPAQEETKAFVLQGREVTSTVAPINNDKGTDLLAKGANSRGFKAMWDSVSESPAVIAGLAGIEIGMWNSVGYVAQAVGLQTTDASKSAFICSLAVVVVPILNLFVGKKMLSREIIGAIMAVVGVGFLELGGGSGEIHGLEGGDIASLIQPLAFGMGFWKMEHAMRKFPAEASRLTAGQLFAIFVASVMYMIGTPGESLPDMAQITAWLTDPLIAGALFWTGIVTTAITIYMETLALKTLSAAETTMIFSTEPLWGAAFAAVVVGERFGLGAAVGASLILGGCLFSNMGMDWMKTKKDENLFDASEEKGTEMKKRENNNLEAESSSPVSGAARLMSDDSVPSTLVRSGIAGAAGGVVALLDEIDVDSIGSAAQDVIDKL